MVPVEPVLRSTHLVGLPIKQGRQSDRGRLLWCHTQQSPNPGEMIYKACFIVRIMSVILPRLPFSMEDNGKLGIYITNYVI